VKSKAKKKSSAGTKKIKGKQHKSTSGTPFPGITVTNGIPSPNPASVPAGELIPFENTDPTDYYIQLFVHGNHPAVDVLLPKLSPMGTVKLMADPHATNGTQCTYNLIPTVQLRASGTLASQPTAGGTHVIVITSSVASKAAAAAG
jgi:hypothetical protein